MFVQLLRHMLQFSPPSRGPEGDNGSLSGYSPRHESGEFSCKIIILKLPT